jgi:hypothetical protein
MGLPGVSWQVFGLLDTGLIAPGSPRENLTYCRNQGIVR